jgi:hypothetical protein
MSIICNSGDARGSIIGSQLSLVCSCFCCSDLCSWEAGERRLPPGLRDACAVPREDSPLTLVALPGLPASDSATNAQPPISAAVFHL